MTGANSTLTVCNALSGCKGLRRHDTVCIQTLVNQFLFHLWFIFITWLFLEVSDVNCDYGKISVSILHSNLHGYVQVSLGCINTGSEREWGGDLRGGALFSTNNWILIFWIINRDVDNSYSRPHERADLRIHDGLSAMTKNLVCCKEKVGHLFDFFSNF